MNSYKLQCFDVAVS